jgi:hypothetical protein
MLAGVGCETLKEAIGCVAYKDVKEGYSRTPGILLKGCRWEGDAISKVVCAQWGGQRERNKATKSETQRSGRRSDRGVWSLLNWPRAPRDAARSLIVSVPFICR